jgi:hypothetical protein
MAKQLLINFLLENQAYYKHKVGMADAMAERNDAYGQSETLNNIGQAADILSHMQMVNAHPEWFDLKGCE